ncbi:uncharacterized protein LOC143003273 [Genypterus blacodes]|uniref:uncharacterized protein LOC143003273 n=1 Tax=Genypterus blacodes TaxID=154954 RepID=UPI003F759E77
MKSVAVVALLLGFLAISHALTCTEAPRLFRMRNIDAGQGQVVATDLHSRAFFLSGQSWYRLGTFAMNQVSVGPAGTWGVDRSGYVYKYIAGNFQRASTSRMRLVDAGGNGQVVGISTSSVASCLPSGSAAAYSGRGNLGFRGLRAAMLDYSCGPYGCWGTNRRQQVLYSSLSPTNCRASWRVIGGSLATITVGTDGSVYGVNRNGHLFQRIGVSRRNPLGSRWNYIRTCTTIKNVTYDLRNLWLQTTSGFLLQCRV